MYNGQRPVYKNKNKEKYEEQWSRKILLYK